MSTITRWQTVLLMAVLLLGLGLATAGAAPSAPPPKQPYVGPEIIISDLNNREIVPNIVYNRRHNEYLVVWQTSSVADPETIRGARISGTGKLLANFQINGHPSKPSFQPAAAYDPVHDRYLVVFLFNNASGNHADLLGRFIPWDGPDPAFKSFPIATWPTVQINPAVAYGRAVEEFLVVWSNLYPPPSALPHYISGRRIRAADGSFPGTGSDLTITHPTNLFAPKVAYNLSRNEYLVVYSNFTDILGTRYTGNLNHDFGGEFEIAVWPNMENSPDVAACREIDQYFVTWESYQGSATQNAIYGRFVSGSGVTGKVLEIDDTTGNEVAGTVACNDAGNQYLVAWQTEYANGKHGIWARFVQPGGQMSDDLVVQHPDNTKSRTRPAVAGGRSNYMAVWEHERDNSSFLDIHGRLITPYTVFTPVIRGQ